MPPPPFAHLFREKVWKKLDETSFSYAGTFMDEAGISSLVPLCRSTREKWVESQDSSFFATLRYIICQAHSMICHLSFLNPPAPTTE
jgi:hypothetical protein